MGDWLTCGECLTLDGLADVLTTSGVSARVSVITGLLFGVNPFYVLAYSMESCVV